MDRYRKSATRELNLMGEKMSLIVAQWLSQAKPVNIWITCGSCTYMKREGPAYCHKYNMVPPVAIVVDAVKCEGYSDESEIPF